MRPKAGGNRRLQTLLGHCPPTARLAMMPDEPRFQCLMITSNGQIVCTNCNAVSPGKGFLESMENATKSGWTGVTDCFYGNTSVYHFCNKCGEAAQRFMKEIEERELASFQKKLTRNLKAFWQMQLNADQQRLLTTVIFSLDPVLAHAWECGYEGKSLTGEQAYEALEGYYGELNETPPISKELYLTAVWPAILETSKVGQQPCE